LISGVPTVARSWATMRSQASATPNAPASTWPPAAQIVGAQYFQQTGHNLSDITADRKTVVNFGRYWDNNGGLRQFGYPISEIFPERLEDGNTYLVQYFERARFEYHPEHKGTTYEVQLGQFGRRILAETPR